MKIREVVIKEVIPLCKTTTDLASFNVPFFICSMSIAFKISLSVEGYFDLEMTCKTLSNTL